MDSPNIKPIHVIILLLIRSLKGYKVGFLEIVKEEKWVCISYVFVIIACGSTTGLIFACVLLCRFINVKSILYVAILLFVVFPWET